MTTSMGAKPGGDGSEPTPVVSTGAERRQAPRVLVDLDVDYSSEENFLFAYIADISDTGIFIRTTAPEAAGTRVNLRFSAPGQPATTVLQVEGEVLWVNPFRPGQPDNIHPGMGIRFVDIDEVTRKSLLDLIRRFAYLS